MDLYNVSKGCYIVCAYDARNNGHMVRSYNTLKEAKAHIRYQIEEMHSTSSWNILHIIDMEWL